MSIDILIFLMFLFIISNVRTSSSVMGLTVNVTDCFTSFPSKNSIFHYQACESPTTYRSRGFIRSLIFKFPPDYSGNPYSYRRIHFVSTV